MIFVQAGWPIKHASVCFELRHLFAHVVRKHGISVARLNIYIYFKVYAPDPDATCADSSIFKYISFIGIESSNQFSSDLISEGARPYKILSINAFLLLLLQAYGLPWNFGFVLFYMLLLFEFQAPYCIQLLRPWVWAIESRGC